MTDRRMSRRAEWRFVLGGWLLFTASAVGFAWTTAAAGDRVGLAASLLFLLGCLVFLVPVWVERPPKGF
jgi:hypothetical protein